MTKKDNTKQRSSEENEKDQTKQYTLPRLDHRREDKIKEKRTKGDKHNSKRSLQHSQNHTADEYELNMTTLHILQDV